MLQRMIQDDVTPANAALFSAMMDVVVRQDRILEKKNPFTYTADIIVVKAGTVLTLQNGTWKSFDVTADVELTVGDLDTGTFTVGTDYYVYIVDEGPSGTFMLSANATYPAGHNASDSRKIGGFHYGHIRKVSADGLWVPVDSEGTKFGSGATGWEDNVTVGIVPNSVWDMKHRPKAAPESMVEVGGFWVDIYPASVAEAITYESATNGLHVATGRLQTRYGAVPATGTEGAHWYTFQELAARAGKRLPSYDEWVMAAYGNPQGQDAADDYGWTKTTNTQRARAGCHVNPSTGAYDAASGIKPAAISATNITDAVGNVWEWTASLMSRWDSGTDWGWHDVLGSGKGQLYGYNAEHLIALLAGASWDFGVLGGPRAANAEYRPWSVSTRVGARLACDSL